MKAFRYMVIAVLLFGKSQGKDAEKE